MMVKLVDEAEDIWLAFETEELPEVIVYGRVAYVRATDLAPWLREPTYFAKRTFFSGEEE